MLRVLLTGTGVVTALYLLINIALVSSVGLGGLREEKLVTEPVEAVFGPLGVVAVAVIVCVAALSTLNGTMFTGARSILALGQNFPLLGPFGEINQRSGAPTNAIIVQAVIALGLIGFGATTRDGFTAMVEYTAPTFWMFMALVGFSLFIFRWREPGRQMPFRVPLYPTRANRVLRDCRISRAREHCLHRVGRPGWAGHPRIGHPALLAWTTD